MYGATERGWYKTTCELVVCKMEVQTRRKHRQQGVKKTC